MKEKVFFRPESISERHPNKMSNPHRHYKQQGVIQFVQIMDYINPLHCIELKVNNPEQIFICLRLLDDPENFNKNAIIINNECQCNHLILLDREADRFYFGFDMDGNMTSKGVFPFKKAKGTDFSIVNERFVVIVRTFETSNIIRNMLNTTLA